LPLKYSGSARDLKGSRFGIAETEHELDLKATTKLTWDIGKRSTVVFAALYPLFSLVALRFGIDIFNGPVQVSENGFVTTPLAIGIILILVSFAVAFVTGRVEDRRLAMDVLGTGLLADLFGLALFGPGGTYTLLLVSHALIIAVLFLFAGGWLVQASHAFGVGFLVLVWLGAPLCGPGACVEQSAATIVTQQPPPNIPLVNYTVGPEQLPGVPVFLPLQPVGGIDYIWSSIAGDSIGGITIPPSASLQYPTSNQIGELFIPPDYYGLGSPPSPGRIVPVILRPSVEGTVQRAVAAAVLANKP
jgi:hypothetical protein